MRAEKAGVGTSEPLTDVIWRNVQSGWSFAFDHQLVEVDISMWWRLQGFPPTTVVAVVEVPVAFWRCFSAAAAALAVTVARSSGPSAVLRFLSLADTAAAAGGVKTRMKIGVVARNAAAAGIWS